MKTTNDDKTIKQLKDTIEILKKEINKLKTENKTIVGLKQAIIKIQEEKMDLSKKLMEMESQSILYKDNDDQNDEMLYNPQLSSSKRNLIKNNKILDSVKDFMPIQVNITKKNFSITNFSFFFESKNKNSLKEMFNNKNEEILMLKNELIRKEQIINEYKKEKILNNNNSASKNSEKKANPYFSNIKQNNNNDVFKNNKKDEYFPILSRSSFRDSNKLINDSIFEENDSNLFLENNIYKEIQNILEEKRNFILNTLTYENFSFDILKDPKKGGINGGGINNNNIDKILELIKQRKKEVEIAKKKLEGQIK